MRLLTIMVRKIDAALDQSWLRGELTPHYDASLIAADANKQR
jgi:hypothetical protein